MDCFTMRKGDTRRGVENRDREVRDMTISGRKLRGTRDFRANDGV